MSAAALLGRATSGTYPALAPAYRLQMIDGTCSDRFQPVRDAFAANFVDPGELGAAVAVVVATVVGVVVGAMIVRATTPSTSAPAPADPAPSGQAPRVVEALPRSGIVAGGGGVSNVYELRTGYPKTTDGAVVIRSRSYSRSSRSRITSRCSRPRKPQRKPKPSAAEVSIS